MNITFYQISKNQINQATSEIHVVFDYPQTAKKPPLFKNQNYTFYINENIEPNSLIRNASLTIFEDEPLSIYYSGFYLEVLDASNLFDIEPKNGMGNLVSFLKLKEDKHLDHETGPTIFNLRVRYF